MVSEGLPLSRRSNLGPSLNVLNPGTGSKQLSSRDSRFYMMVSPGYLLQW